VVEILKRNLPNLLSYLLYHINAASGSVPSGTTALVSSLPWDGTT
jgi:hypothetical protein